MPANQRRRSALPWLLLSCALLTTGLPHVCPPAVSAPALPRNSNEANGYEELLAAAALLSSSKLYSQAVIDPSTLSQKRRALADRPVVRALALLHQGLARSVFDPPQAGYDAQLPHFARFRSLARLLRMQQYVLLADGRVPEAMESLRLGLRLSRVVQTDSLIAALVGLAISSMVVQTVGDHLDQLSARDCEQLYQISLDWLRQPSPLPRVLEGERRFAKGTLAEQRRQAASAPPSERPREPAGDPAAEQELSRLGGRSPQNAVDAFREAEALIDQLYDRQLAELRRQPWERAPVAAPEGSVAAHLVSPLVPALNRVLDAYPREEALVRLLACHGAVRRYRWEHDRLPSGLGDLKLGALAIDPFTGQPLRYEPRGTTYRLSSVGPKAEDDDPRAVDGRRPVTVGPDVR